jgi:multidrug efflux pump subunit AcrA (membrane-fusion protein)
MAVLGHVPLPTVRGITIPSTAFTNPNHDKLLTVDADGVVHSVAVKELAENGTVSVVTGLTAGTRVVTDGQSSVGDGEKVAIK